MSKVTNTGFRRSRECAATTHQSVAPVPFPRGAFSRKIFRSRGGEFKARQSSSIWVSLLRQSSRLQRKYSLAARSGWTASRINRYHRQVGRDLLIGGAFRVSAAAMSVPKSPANCSPLMSFVTSARAPANSTTEDAPGKRLMDSLRHLIGGAAVEQQVSRSHYVFQGSIGRNTEACGATSKSYMARRHRTA